MIKLILHPNEELEQSVELESRTILIGRSDENDLTIDDPSVASHHVRIEKRGDEFVVKDLSKQGILVDGDQVREAPVAVGSIITIGDVEILFKGETTLPVEAEDAALAAAEPGSEAGALITTPGGAGHAGGYLPTETFIRPAHLEPEQAFTTILPALSVIFSALGLLFVVLAWVLNMSTTLGMVLLLLGCVIGISVGLLSLAGIRRRGGLLRHKLMATRGVVLGFVCLALGFAFLGWQAWTGSLVGTISSNEAGAKRALQAVCQTQYYARYGFFLDKNENGAPEYGTLEDLASLRYSAMPDLKRDLTGYELVMVRANEDGFLCYARPTVYGRTGRRTYAIDERGTLRGKDLRGADLTDYDRELPPVAQGKSVLETGGEQIAQDLVEVAKRAAANNDYDRAIAVASATRETFPMTDAVKKELDAVGADVAPRIVEIRSAEEHDRAIALIEEGEIIRALEILTAAEQNYPTSSYIVKIRELIALIREEHFKELEAAAETIYTEAQKLELDGKFTEAKQRYMKIRDQYSMTTYGEGIEAQIYKIEAKIREVEAARYVAQLRTLAAEKDYVEIVRIVELLTRRYADTEEFERNYETIELAERKGRAYSQVVQAVGHLRDRAYESALASFDKALEAYPDVRTHIKPYLEQCYYLAGGSAYKRKDFRTALDLFERYRRLPPKQNKLHDLYLMRAYYEVGKLDYQQGDFEAAERNLFVCSGQFDKHPEFNYIFGSVLMERKDHKRAVEYFTRYFRNSSADPEKRYYAPSLRKRGYSHAQLAAELEAEVKDLVLVNAVYRPLIDADALRAPGKEDDKEGNGGDDSGGGNEGNGGDDDDDDNEGGTDRFRVGSTGTTGTVLMAQEEQTNGDEGDGDEDEDGSDDVKEVAFRRILDLIVEIQAADVNLKKEHRAAVGDLARRDRLEIKRSRFIEFFQQKQANLTIEIDRENLSKRDIIRRIDRAVLYLAEGIRDLNAVNKISARNRDLELVIRKLDYKRHTFAAAHTHLFTAYTQDIKNQRDAYRLLDLVLKEFSGWPNPMDIGRSLRAMFMMKPGAEEVAEGLRMLLKGFDVETDLDVILRSGGEPTT